MDGKDTGGQKGGKEKKRVAGRAMESRFSFSSQPYRRESPYTVAVCSEEGRMRKEEIEEKRMKRRRRRWCSRVHGRCSGERGEEERWREEGPRDRRRWIEREEKESPSTRRRPKAMRRPVAKGRSGGEDSATFEVLLAFAKFADLFLRPVVVVVKRFNISTL